MTQIVSKESLNPAISEGKADLKKSLADALAQQHQATQLVEAATRALLTQGTEVYWYTTRDRECYLQRGVVLDCSGIVRSDSSVARVQNSKTHNTVTLSLYDLRFYLQGIEPDFIGFGFWSADWFLKSAGTKDG